MFVLSRIDLFGTPPTLNFYGNEKRTSMFGGMCTLLFFGFVIWAAYNASLELFNQSNPQIVQSEITVEEPNEITLSNQEFPFGFIIQTPLSFTAKPAVGFTDTSIYTVELQHKILNRVPQADGTIKKVWTYTNLTTEKCTKEYFGEYASSFSSFTFQGSHCLSLNQTELDNLKIQGLTSSALYQAITVKIKVCKNETSNNTCASPAKITQYLSGAYFNALFIDSVMNLQNKSTPINRYREMYSTLMNPLSYKTVDIEVGKVGVETDSGWLLEDVDSKKSFKVNRVSELIDLNPSLDKTMIACTFKASRLESYYTRSYKKLPTTLAEVGGLANVFLGVMLFIITPYLKLKSREALMNEIFEVKEEAKPKRHDKKKTYQQQKDQYKNMQKGRGKKNSKFSGQGTSLSSEGSPFKLLSSPKHSNEAQDIQGIELSLQNDRPRRLAKDRFVSIKDEHQDSMSREKNEQVENFVNAPLSPVSLIGKSDRDGLTLSSSPWYKIDMPGGDSVQHKSEDLDDLEQQKVKVNEEKMDQIEKPLKIHSESEREDTLNPHDIEKNIIINQVEEKLEVNNQEEKAAEKQNDKNKKDLLQSELKFWEYLVSVFYKPKVIKDKMDLIEEGVKNIDQRLDLSNILKKFCEVDKIIALLLDIDQLELFNNMPKPRIQKDRSYLDKQSTFQRNLHKKITVVELQSNKRQIIESYNQIKAKPEQTNIDQRLLDIFKDKLSKYS